MRSLQVPIGFLFTVVLSTIAFAQQTERDLYLSLYKHGEYEKAAIVLKRMVKSNPFDADAWHYLGLTQIQLGKEKDAVKSLGKASSLKPDNALFRFGFAYGLFLRNENSASSEAQAALELDPNIPDAHYILGVIANRRGSYAVAYQRAKKAIALHPKHADAHVLKAEALVGSFAMQSGTVLKTTERRNHLLEEAVADLETYRMLTPQSKQSDYFEDYYAALKFFSDYYGRDENQRPDDLETKAQSSTDETPLRILYKHKPSYTDAARQAGVSGSIKLLVGFAGDGTIKHLMVIKPLGYGLDEEAVRAARKMRFEPATRNGQPISVVRPVEFTFAIF